MWSFNSQSSVIWQYTRVTKDSIQLQMLYKDNGKVDKDMKLSTNETIGRKIWRVKRFIYILKAVFRIFTLKSIANFQKPGSKICFEHKLSMMDAKRDCFVFMNIDSCKYGSLLGTCCRRSPCSSLGSFCWRWIRLD